MRKLISTLALVVAASAAFAGVTVNTPTPGAYSGSPVHFVASASGSTTISAMIVYIDGVEKYRTYTNHVDTYIGMGTGGHKATISAWDNWGGFYTKQVWFNATSSGGSGGVTITAPSNGAGTGSPVHFVASASGYNPISSMIIYVDNVQKYLIYSNHLDTYVGVGGGSHSAIVKAWDNTGRIYQNTVNFSVGGTTTTASTSSSGSSVTAGTTVWNVQSLGGWGSCSDCAGAGGHGPIAGYAFQQHQGSPSLTGNASKYSVWGSTPYADVLWWKQLIGDSSTNNWAHHFIYDVYFYMNNPGAAQSLEFDINQFVNGHSLIFGTQCNIRSGGVWDIWDNRASKWVHTGKPCPPPAAYSWHHVTIEAERASDGGDWLHYVAITMDGNKTYLNAWYPPASTGWKGITVNFQMDGNYAMQPYSVWLDKLHFSYW